MSDASHETGRGRRRRRGRSRPANGPTPAGSAQTATPGAGAASGSGSGAAAGSAAGSAHHRSSVVWAGVHRPFVAGFFLVLGGLTAFGLGMAITDLVTIWIYIAFALFAALGLDPIVRWLTARRISRTWAIVIVYVVFVLALVAVLWLIIPTVIRQIAQFFTDLPDMIGSFQQTELYTWAQAQFGDQVPAIVEEVQRFLTDPANIAAIGGGVLQIGVTIGTGISGLIIVVVLSLYFLATLPEIKQAFYRLVPARSRELTAELTDQITDSVGGYLGGMVILAFFNAVFSFVLYSVLALPFPALLAVVAFTITIIPLVGTVLFWGIGSVVALFADPLSALIFAGAYLVYMQIEAYILTPRVMKKTVSVPGSLVVIGALIGGTLMGLLGALVAIPLTASLLLIVKKVFIPKQDARV